jgi:hypothetical protein
VLASEDEDPTTWFNEIARLNKRFESIDSDYKKKEWELKAHVLGKLSQELLCSDRSVVTPAITSQNKKVNSGEWKLVAERKG